MYVCPQDPQSTAVWTGQVLKASGHLAWAFGMMTPKKVPCYENVGTGSAMREPCPMPCRRCRSSPADGHVCTHAPHCVSWAAYQPALVQRPETLNHGVSFSIQVGTLIASTCSCSSRCSTEYMNFKFIRSTAKYEVARAKYSGQVGAARVALHLHLPPKT